MSDDLFLAHACRFCGVLTPGIGCVHHPPRVAAVEPPMILGIGGVGILSTPSTIRVNHLGLPLCSDDIEAFAKKEIV